MIRNILLAEDHLEEYISIQDGCRVFDYWGEVEKFCKDGKKKYKGEVKMSRTAVYQCDGCGKNLGTDKEAIEKAVKVPGKDGKNVVAQLCDACATKFQKHVSDFFKK